MIKLSEPFFFGKELAYLKKVLKDKWISPNGNIVKKFEKKIQKYTTGKYNLGTVNCTAAIQLAIRLLNPKNNEEIIVPSITFAATINAVIYNNCKPIFLDCDNYLLLDKKKFYSFIKKIHILKIILLIIKKQKKKSLELFS